MFRHPTRNQCTIRTCAGTAASGALALVNNFQFDSRSSVLGWQSRFRWILKPGNDLYVVYTHHWLENPLLDRFATLDKRRGIEGVVHAPVLISRQQAVGSGQ